MQLLSLRTSVLVCATVLGRGAVSALLKDSSKIMTAGKTAQLGNGADWKRGVSQQMLCLQQPGSGQVLVKAAAGQSLEQSGKISCFQIGHLGSLR